MFWLFGHEACGTLVPHPGIEQYEKAGGEGSREDEMVGGHHRTDELEFEQALGVGDGQECLLCFTPWGHKESDMTELNPCIGSVES